MAKVLIVGATGFIGSKLVEAAVNQGFEVTVSVRSSSNTSKIDHLNIKKVQLNFTDIDQMAKIIADLKPDFVINNAGVTKAKTQAEYDKVNVQYAVNLANACMKSGVDLKKYIYISSLAAHGPADLQNENILRVQQSPNPVTKYGISKLKAENQLKNVEGLKYLFLRPTAVYGPEERDLYTVFKMVNSGLGMYSGDGDQKLTFIFIDDLINIILRTLDEQNVNKSYFVTDGKSYSPKELNRFISQALGKKILQFGLPLPLINLIATISEFFGKFSKTVPPLNLDKVNEIKAKNWTCEIDSLTRDLNYTPKVFLEEGINKTVTWYRANKWL